VAAGAAVWGQTFWQGLGPWVAGEARAVECGGKPQRGADTALT